MKLHVKNITNFVLFDNISLHSGIFRMHKQPQNQYTCPSIDK